MSFKISAIFNRDQLRAWFDKTSEKTLQKVVARSLNKTAVTIRKVAQQKIREKVKLSASEIRNALPIKKKAQPSQPIDSQEVTIHANTKGLSLSQFNPQPTKGSVSVNITGKRQVIRSAFIARMPNASRPSVFRRVRVRLPGTAIRRGKKGSELPIEKQAYKSIASILPEVADQLTSVAQKRFAEEFERNFKHQFEGGD